MISIHAPGDAWVWQPVTRDRRGWKVGRTLTAIASTLTMRHLALGRCPPQPICDLSPARKHSLEPIATWSSEDALPRNPAQRKWCHVDWKEISDQLFPQPRPARPLQPPMFTGAPQQQRANRPPGVKAARGVPLCSPASMTRQVRTSRGGNPDSARPGPSIGQAGVCVMPVSRSEKPTVARWAAPPSHLAHFALLLQHARMFAGSKVVYALWKALKSSVIGF
ncbi:hypothetical protein GQ53DRAFT_106382 [Thozetella sp. PMI_491]|nr:hypothetical protein GQ53DRAFT_106382 [Thozetella sp. PMI_491]